MKTRSGQKIKLTSVEELLGVPNEEVATEIDLVQIRSFKNHPFKVIDDEKMQDLMDSIKENKQDAKPKRRGSVIKKLREKQVAIAVRDGKPVPKYLQQAISQERSRR